MTDGPRDANPKVEKILAGARQVFFEHGFGSASTDMVQRAAGVSKSTVYSYFPSKDALFVAVVQAECKSLVDGIHGERIKARTIRETLLRVGEKLCESVLAPSVLALLRIVIAEAPRFPLLGVAIREAGALPLQRELTEYLVEAGWRRDASIAEPRSAARHFVGMVLHDVQMECLLGLRSPPGPGEIRDIVEAAVDDFLRAHPPS